MGVVFFITPSKDTLISTIWNATKAPPLVELSDKDNGNVSILWMMQLYGCCALSVISYIFLINFYLRSTTTPRAENPAR